MAVSEPGPHTATGQEWAENFRDKPLIIDLSVRMAEDRINGWLEADLRFKNTWYRQRHDLGDQSQSGYDLSLACFGLSAGCTEQEIVDLIVHHRALHKQKQRTALDYFQRTISKAASRTDSEFPDSANAGPSSSKEGQNSGPASEPDKAAICRNLSEVLGAQIDKLTKISGRSPIFQMDLAEGKAEFSNVGKLISQTCVRNTLAGIAGKLMRLFKPKQWEKIAQALLDACVVEEGGEEM